MINLSTKWKALYVLMDDVKLYMNVIAGNNELVDKVTEQDFEKVTDYIKKGIESIKNL
jgi:hypothetical protein